MIIWGMVGNSHDASLAVFVDNKLAWASLSKDFSDVPNDPDFNWTQLEVAKQSYGLPDKVIWYERPFLKTLRQFAAGQGWLAKENNIKKYLNKWGINCPIEYIDHHESHAAYGYYTSGFQDATIICIDSIGEFETFTIWNGTGTQIQKVYRQKYPHSIGLFYSAMTQRCGLKANAEEYILSDYAIKGDRYAYLDAIEKDFTDQKMLKNGFWQVRFKENLHRGCNWWRPELQSEKELIDIGASTQEAFERMMMRISTSASFKLPSKNLVLTGGCALNKLMVKQLKPNWDSIWIPPNPGDPGSCIGAVLGMERTHIDFDPKVWYNKV